MMIYILTWLLELGGLAFFWGLPGPAAGGALGMGAFVWLALRAQHPAKTAENT